MMYFTLIFFVTAISYTSSSRQDPVYLGSAEDYVILAQAGITTTGNTKITGDIGVSPIAATAMTGFNLKLDSSGTHSTSPLVRGRCYAADYQSPTPSRLNQAINDLGSAYNDAASRNNPDALNRGINGQLRAGLYKWTSALSVDDEIILSGNPSSVFIFQVQGTLDFQSSAKIFLDRGVQASNVIWQATGAVTLAAGSQVQGIILGKTSISFKSGASLSRGRALAQTAVTLISNTITKP